MATDLLHFGVGGSQQALDYRLNHLRLTVANVDDQVPHIQAPARPADP